MYEIERTEYGIRITISGQFGEGKATEFIRNVRTHVRQRDGSFCVLADLREMETFPPEVGEQMAELMEFCNANGMERSADIVETATTSLQMEQLVAQAGIDEYVIDATTVEEAESQALDWIEDGMPPTENGPGHPS
jgi:thioesterase domain-containing protein